MQPVTMLWKLRSRNVNHNYCNAVREQCNQLVRNIMLRQFKSVHVPYACKLRYRDCNILCSNRMQPYSHKQRIVHFSIARNDYVYNVEWRRWRRWRLTEAWTALWRSRFYPGANRQSVVSL